MRRIDALPFEEVVLSRFDLPLFDHEALLNGVDCGVTIMDRSRTVLAMNASAEAFSGRPWSAEEGKCKCHKRLFGLEKPCPGCPVTEALKLGGPVCGKLSFHGRSFLAKTIPDASTGILLCCMREVTESVALLARLEAGEKQYSRIVNGIPLGILIGEIISDSKGKPLDYRVVETNPAFEDHTGIPAEQLLNKRITKVFPNMREHLAIELFANVVVTGEPVELCEFNKLIHRYVHYFVFCVQPGRFACIINDLSDKKDVEDRLRLVEGAVEASSDEIYFLTEQGYFIYGNTAVSEKLGVKKQDLRNAHISSFNPSISPEWWNDFIAQIRQRGHFQIESVHRRGDGTIYPVELNSTLVRTDRSDIICTIARDTTVQTTELTNLSRSRDHMESALDTASLCFWTLTPLNGRFNSDRRWAILTGQGNLPLSGSAEDYLFPAIHIGDRRRLRLELSSCPYESGSFTCRLVAGDGVRRVRLRWHRTRDKSGLSISAVAEDITSERLLGLAAAGSDSPGMDALLGYSGELLARLRKASDAPDLHSVRRLLSDITADLEALSPVPGEREELVYLDTFLRELDPTMRGLLGEGCSLTLEIPSSTAVQGSQDLLERFFLRLAGFVGSALPEGAAMKIWSLSGGGVCGCTRIIIDLVSPGSMACFSPGHQALVEAYSAVKAMKGTVAAERRDDGARFTVILPSAVMEPSGRVMVASDNSIEGRTVATVLRHMNLRVQVCSSASEAVDAMEPGDALILSSGLADFPSELPERTLVLGAGYRGPAANLSKSWTITSLRAAVRRVLQRN